MDEQAEQTVDDSQTRNNQQAELEALREKALQILVPMVDQIEGAPEHRFELLMTAARSSGNSNVLHKALEAAQQIENPGEKANAVIDVLNEISYHLSQAA